MAETGPGESTLFMRWLYKGALSISAVAVVVTLAASLREPVSDDYVGFLTLVAMIYAGPGVLALIVAVLFWRRPVVEFGPRLILALVAAIWGLLVLTLQLSFLSMTWAGAE